MPQPPVSRRLKVLRERDMAEATRPGQTVEHRLDDRRPIEALDLLRSVLHDNLSRRIYLVEHLS